MGSFKVILAVALMVVPLLASPVYEEHKEVEVEHYAHPKYEFKYGVRDEHTHDIKEQAEKRDGDKVEGYYTLVEPDGTTRTVHYSSDKHSGFIAQVHKSGHSVHPAQVHKKIAVAHVAPVIAHHHQPVHVAPVHIAAVHAAPSYSHGGPSYAHQGGSHAQHSGYSQHISHGAPSYGHHGLGSSSSYSHQPIHSAPSYSHQPSSHGGATSYSNFEFFADAGHKP